MPNFVRLQNCVKPPANSCFSVQNKQFFALPFSTLHKTPTAFAGCRGYGYTTLVHSVIKNPGIIQMSS